ncbi:hypothetical protein [Pimelobacter simplex]|uniref:hypothetical protein n=1 Tax=Nocardioides simplex TaxID=2045 RepID=UPI00214F80CF|nr:hypothetical protein [Pimelobacter simplex]UUW88469.1 hypothetical protein M0M43_22380 [Pimelobacter simplex]UUW97973.1 hypothetical protein M0M48_11025 [Pimelobacter simplex]
MTDQPAANVPTADTAGLIDDFLDLDEILSAQVHRAEKTEILYLKPHLEAEIDALEADLEKAVSNPRWLDAVGEVAVGDQADDSATAEDLAEQIQSKRREYAESGKKVLLRQMPSDEWTEFEATWKKVLEAGSPYPAEMWDDLISKCAVRPTMPVDKLKALRKKLGHPPLHNLALTAWKLNTEGGVSVPFSRLSSDVLRPKAFGTN